MLGLSSNCSVHISSGQSFSIGLFISFTNEVLLTTFNKHPLTRLSRPIQSFYTFPILHRLFGNLSSLISIISPLFILLTGSLSQFLWRSLSPVRYSELHLFQNRWIKVCKCWKRFKYSFYASGISVRRFPP